MRYFGVDGSAYPPPKETLPPPAPAPPVRTLHGRLGCWHNLRGPHIIACKDTDQPGHHREIWWLLDWACRHGQASPTEIGGMRLDIHPRWREQLVDSLDRLTERYPDCMTRVGPTAWALPCPGCAKPNFGVIVA